MATVAAKRQPLADYHARRDFARTPEPADGKAEASPRRGVRAASERLLFVVQKHAATRLHYDLRLEWGGVLLSWAVPKGPSFDPADKRIAVRTEDHPLSYATFEGTIPARQYGAGEMIVWDRGAWRPEVDVDEGLAAGKLVFALDGEKLVGRWELVRIRKPGEKQDPWILFKKRDAWAQPLADYDVVRALPDSVIARPLGTLSARDPRGDGEAKAAPAALLLDAGAVAAVLASAPLAEAPARLAPQLATLAASPSAVRGDGWLYEIKFDGYRVLAHYTGGIVKLHTRQGHDWTAKMTSLAAVFETLPIADGWLDGELVVLGADGTPNFNALQNAFDGAATEGIVCFLFDVPFLDGHDLRALPLEMRRAILQSRLVGADDRHGDRLRLSAAFEGDAASVLASACRMQLEGIVCKRRDSTYASRRSEAWLKLKCQRRERFVVGGWTDREAAVGEVGSLLLGTRERRDGPLRWVGNVGTGWDAKAAASIRKTLAALETDRSPFDAAHAPERGRWTRKAGGGEHWVRPRVEVEVGFAEWTPDGHIRHPVFHSLHGPEAGATKPPPTVAISHPTRVIDTSTGLTKLDLVRWYESVADRILPHLAGRPVSLVRGPSGVGGTLFFQKHGEKLGIPGIVELDPALWPGHPAMLEVSSVEALLGCAQMNVIEFHTWNSTVAHIDRPDRVIFDLDPGEGVAWAQIQEAALLVRALLDELGLASWLKTSGGKGLHVVVPIDATRRASLDYDVVKAFSQRAVQHLARTIPQRFVAKSGGANRIGRIFVDWIRNGRGATTAAAFSARARPGLGVSMPVAWETLPSLTGGAQWTIADAREHLSFETADPWAGYAGCRQTLAAAIKRLGG